MRNPATPLPRGRGGPPKRRLGLWVRARGRAPAPVRAKDKEFRDDPQH